MEMRREHDRIVLRIGGLVAVFLAAAVSVGCAAGSDESEQPQSITDLTTDATDAPPDPDAFAFGQEIRIREGSIAPAQLVAIKGNDVVVVNETSEPQELVFTNWSLADGSTTTGPIPPGGSWTFQPVTVASIAFALAADDTITGRLQVDAGAPCC